MLDDYQERVHDWAIACFGEAIANDRVERSHRFLEEALELVQSLGMTRDDCMRLVDYVFRRPAGHASQEVGGVMVTLAALCSANGIDLEDAAEAELRRVWIDIDKIRAKQAAKPKGSVEPAAVASASEDEPPSVSRVWECKACGRPLR
jgi:hypothetical protein